MSRGASGLAIPSNVNPDKLTALLLDAGWRTVGGRRGVYARFAPPGAGEQGTVSSLIVPLDVNAPDFSDVMRSVLLQLSEDRDLWIRSVYPRLAVDATDEFRFRKESDAPSGLIPWRSGEKLYEAARRTLLAGAKSFMGPGRHFVNRYGGFASRYLDLVFMGQTAPGSYVVTAYAPSNAAVPLRGGASRAQDLVEIAPINVTDSTAPVRAVNEAVVRAIEATAEAVQHYKASGSLSGFIEGVTRGISYEMTNAILGIASGSSEADITIGWDLGTPHTVGLETQFTFDPSDVTPLSKAAVKLAEDESARLVTMMGRVHLLAKKQAGSPGVFGIDSLQPEGPRKVRVRLADDEDYHEAVRAHEEDLALMVSGKLEKEGNLSWLYDATVVRTLGHIDDYMSKRSGGRNVSGQIELFTENS